MTSKISLCFVPPLLLCLTFACGGSSEGGTSDDQSASQSGDESPTSMEGNDDGTGSEDSDGTSTTDGSGTPSEGEETGNSNASDGSSGGGADDPETVDITVPTDPNGDPEEMLPPEREEPSEPQPDSEPATDPCDGLSCGDPCDLTGDLALLLAAPVPGTTYCDADGQCSFGEPVCEVETEPGDPDPPSDDCSASCPVILICELCDDGETCAEPHVACNPDGSCGETTWTCPEDDSSEPEPEPESEPEPVPERCETADDCPVSRVACAECDDGSAACPAYACVDGSCVLEIPECSTEYDPCAGKEEGDYCSLCAPDDLDCGETGELKTCQNGECMSLGLAK